MATVQIKRGDTFKLECQVLTDGLPTNITGWTIESAVRDDRILVENLAFTLVDAVLGKFRLTATPAQTNLWPVKDLDCDIRYNFVGGEVNTSETFTVQCLLNASD